MTSVMGHKYVKMCVEALFSCGT